MEFTKLIQDEAAKLRELYAGIDDTVIHRDRDARSRRAWVDACDAFHTYRSAIDKFISRAWEERRYADRELIEFAICFLEVDPWFFRSGYLKQELLTRLKRSALDESAKSRLRSVLVDAVNRRGTREFKFYCRLAVALATPEFVKHLRLVAVGIDRARVRRAQIMLERIARHAATDTSA